MLIFGHKIRHDQFGVKGHVGATGVKNVILTKTAISFRLHGMVVGLVYIYQLDLLYKSYGSKIYYGVIWGHRNQKVIFTKML